MVLFLTLHLINCLPPFHLAFSGGSSCSFIWGLFYFLHILATSLCSFLGIRFAMILSLCGIALFSKCPVGFSGTVSLITWDECSSKVPFVVYVGPLAVIESWLLLTFSFMQTTLRFTDGAQPQPWCVSCCACADHMKWNLPAQCLVPAKIFL